MMLQMPSPLRQASISYGGKKRMLGMEVDKCKDT